MTDERPAADEPATDEPTIDEEVPGKNVIDDKTEDKTDDPPADETPQAETARTYEDPVDDADEPELPSTGAKRVTARHKVPKGDSPRRQRGRRGRKGGPAGRIRDWRRRRAERDPLEQLSGRIPVLGVIGATVLAGLLFGPTFGSTVPAAVVVPVVAVAVLTYLCFELARFWRPFEAWRGIASVVLGLLAVVETTLHDTTKGGWLPTAASVRALEEGVRGSWLKTLQSTLPARPDPELVVFVPLLVLVALVVAVQILTRTTARLVSLLPGLLVAGLAQAYHPVTALPAVLVALGFALAATAVLGSVPRIRVRTVVVAVAATTPIILIGTLAAAATDPTDRSAYSLQDQVAPTRKPQAAYDPLENIPGQLSDPGMRLFSVDGPSSTSFWPVVFLDHFNGANWRSTADTRTLGSHLVGTERPLVATQQHRATITIAKLGGPYIPSQDGLDDVTGIRPSVDPKTGELLSNKVHSGTTYSLRWRSPVVTKNGLTGAAVTPHLARDVREMGEIPDNIKQIANEIAGSRAPDFNLALAIEQYLKVNYRVAVGRNLPPGSSYMAAISKFLGDGDKRKKGTEPGVGTSVQFATAFVVLAKYLGIPARIAVGYQQPDQAQPNGRYLITNGDVLARPEVSVRGVGWVPLDPNGSRSRSAAEGDSVADATKKARDELPPPTSDQSPEITAPRDPAVPPKDDESSFHIMPWLRWGGIALLALLILRLVGVPLVKFGRTRMRRRRSGNEAIVSAWLEARDRLRDYGVAITSDMTVRDAGEASRVELGASTGHAMRRLSDLVDLALWSGTLINRYPPDVAWQASDAVRRTLSARPIRERLLAGVTLRGLRSLQ